MPQESLLLVKTWTYWLESSEADDWIVDKEIVLEDIWGCNFYMVKYLVRFHNSRWKLVFFNFFNLLIFEEIVLFMIFQILSLSLLLFLVQVITVHIILLFITLVKYFDFDAPTSGLFEYR